MSIDNKKIDAFYSLLQIPLFIIEDDDKLYTSDIIKLECTDKCPGCDHFIKSKLKNDNNDLLTCKSNYSFIKISIGQNTIFCGPFTIGRSNDENSDRTNLIRDIHPEYIDNLTLIIKNFFKEINSFQENSYSQVLKLFSNLLNDNTGTYIIDFVNNLCKLSSSDRVILYKNEMDSFFLTGNPIVASSMGKSLEFNERILYNNIPDRVMKKLRNNNYVYENGIELKEEFYEIYEFFNCRSFILLPIFFSNNLKGLLVFINDDISNRDKNAIKFCEKTAQLISYYFEKKFHETNSKENEKKYRAIFYNMIDSFFQISIDGKISLVNPSAMKLLKIKEAKQIIGKNISEFIPNSSQKDFLFSHILTHSRTIGFPVTLMDNNNLQIEAEITAYQIKDQNGNLTGIEGTIRDLSRVKNAEKKGELHQNYLNTVIDNLPLGIFAFKADDPHTIYIWNKEMEHLFYYKREIVIGEGIKSTFNDMFYDRIVKSSDKMLKSNKKISIIKRFFITTEKGHFTAKIVLVPIKQVIADESNEDTTIIGIIEDITESILNENKLKKAINNAEAANVAKSQFLANMSHEIRTPLNGILGFAQILSEELKDKDELTDYTSTIISSGKNLLAILNDILDLSKIESNSVTINKSFHSLRELISEIKDIYQFESQKNNIDFLIDINENIPTLLYIDINKIRQVLFNLLGNAFKFTSEGSISVVINLSSKNQTSCDISIDIIDTGIGIDDNYQKLIFEPFQQQDNKSTRNYGGTGLGLTITKKLIEMMNGNISLKSKKNHGSDFSIFLPNILFKNNLTTLDSDLIFNKLTGKKLFYYCQSETEINEMAQFFEQYNLLISLIISERQFEKQLETNRPDIIIMHFEELSNEAISIIEYLSTLICYDIEPVKILIIDYFDQKKLEFIKDNFNDYIIGANDKDELLYRIDNLLG